MGHLFRSEEMNLFQLFVSKDAAHDIMDELGTLGLTQFKDLCPGVNTFSRSFVNEIKRCDEMERRLRYIEEQATEIGSKAFTHPTVDDVHMIPAPTRQEIEKLETNLSHLEQNVRELNLNMDTLNRDLHQILELRQILNGSEKLFRDFRGHEVSTDFAGYENELIQEQKIGSFGYLTGILHREKMTQFHRVLFRAIRGNFILRHFEVEEKVIDPQTEEEVFKNIFIIFFQGSVSRGKIEKICESFGADLHSVPENEGERKALLSDISDRIMELQGLQRQSINHKHRLIGSAKGVSATWLVQIKKEKGIYNTLNKFNYDVTQKCLIGELWCPLKSKDELIAAVKRGNDRSGSSVPSTVRLVRTGATPPTFFRLNKFTSTFQGIVESYGVARYREVSPAPLSAITFPFLFAVMFGDLGHGTMMFLFAIYLVWNEKKLSRTKLNDMVETIFNGRYMILLMGMFSIYTGLLYNDCYSKAMNLFDKGPEEQYPFGVNPHWNGADNELKYYNSLKMKMSILMGVTQMLVGIFLNLLNHPYFKQGAEKRYSFFHVLTSLELWCEFVPQIIYMGSLFGYLCVIIFAKWFMVWDVETPPNLISMLINMFLKPTTIADTEVYGNQTTVQIVLVLLLVVSIPWMLLPKPFLLRRRHNKGYREIGHGSEGEEFDFAEIFVHQVIETIEFVLSGISNTASYLRLWALSLAHAELSKVFWDQLFDKCLKSANFVMVFVGFAIWAFATFGVLLLMESLSAFLHALRLHWVEFMNKFYKGDGYPFMPFDYKTAVMGQQ